MYSFDVFDTLITRSMATPKGIFLLMRKYLKVNKGVYGFPDDFIRNFPALRIDSEKNARRYSPKTEIRCDGAVGLLVIEGQSFIDGIGRTM